MQHVATQNSQDIFRNSNSCSEIFLIFFGSQKKDVTRHYVIETGKLLASPPCLGADRPPARPRPGLVSRKYDMSLCSNM